jgi:hypothetical protein
MAAGKGDPTWGQFFDLFGHLRLCGPYHTPRSHDLSLPFLKQDYGIAKYFMNPTPQYRQQLKYSNRNYLSRFTSNRFLCHVTQWHEGSYNASVHTSINTIDPGGRRVRVNYANIRFNQATLKWTKGSEVLGEGTCFNYFAF